MSALYFNPSRYGQHSITKVILASKNLFCFVKTIYLNQPRDLSSKATLAASLFFLYIKVRNKMCRKQH